MPRSGRARGRRCSSASREGWHPGVVGLVAARLKERFGRPAFAIAWNGGDRHRLGPLDPRRRYRRGGPRGGRAGHPGQGRRPRHGGRHHGRARAAGALRAFLEERLGAAGARGGRPTATSRSTRALTESGATAAFVEDLERAGPFGNGNPAPVFAFPAHRVAFADSAGNGHVRLSLASEAGGSLKAIAFRAAETPLGRALLAARGKPLHVAGTLCLDHYGGSGAAAASRHRRGSPTDLRCHRTRC